MPIERGHPMKLHLSELLHNFGKAMAHFLRDPFPMEPHADVPAMPARRIATPKLEDTEVWHSVTVGDMAEAERLFDSLDSKGFQEREFHMLRNETYMVRWR